MSELILGWLNDELQLSRRVTSFERDFTNGFLFGEILARYNQQLNFNEFVDRDDKDSRLKNFTLLFETFRTLRIGFDSNLVTQIIDGKEGVSKKILYELKMQLEKSTTNYFSKVPKSGLTPLKKVQVGKEVKDQLDAEFFKKRLQETHRAQKRINEENVLKKFSDFHKNQLEKNRMDAQVQEQKALAARDSLRDERRTTLKRATDFRNQWEKSNGEKWQTNMEMRKMNHETDVLYRTKLEALKKKSESEKEDQALKQVSSEIEEFERKFSKKQDDDQEQPAQKASQSPANRSPSDRMTQTLKEKSLGRSIPTATMRVKKNPQLEEISRRQRDKRRRKMIVDLSKHQNLIEIEKREQQIMFCLQQTSKQQKEIEYELWRAWQNKQVIIENRRLRDTKYTQKAQLKQTNAKFKDEELLRTYREEHTEDLRIRMTKQNQLQSIAKVDRRKNLYSKCNDMVLQLLEIAEQCYQHQQNTNSPDIHGEYLNEMIQQFVERTSTPKQIAQQEMKDYIGGRNYWAVAVQRDGQPTEPDKENALPEAALNNYYLGNVLKLLFSKHLSENRAEEIANSFKPELGVCLVGLEFAGKKTVAEFLAKEFKLKIVKVDGIIEERLSSFASLTQTNLDVSQTTAQLVRLCQKGGDLPNELLVELVEQQIRKHPRFLLVDFPLTYEQAVMLSKRLAGIAPKDHTKPSALETKIEQFSKLVLPTQTTWIERTIRSCGLDMLLWLDIGPEESLDRCGGRRWIGERVIHIRDDIGSQVNLLEVGDRGASTVERNNFKRNNLPELKGWFENFGLATEDSEGNSSKFVCWQEVDARPKQPAVAQGVKDIMERVLSYKETYSNHLEKLKQRQAEEQAKQQEKNKQAELIKKKCILSTSEQLQQNLGVALSKNSLNPSFINACVNLWNNLESNTVESYLKAFEGMREQRESSITRLASLKRRFIGQLLRQDSKFNLAKQFQLEYNKFVDNNRDMVEEDQTKEELHQRIDDLEDQLKELTEGKRDEATDERTQIMNSGWLQNRLERYYMYVQLLVAAEMERSVGCQQLLTDYYCAAYSIEAKEVPESNNDLNVDQALQVINSEFECPRIDKLFAEANRVFNRQEPEVAADDKNKKGGKAPPAPPKKDDKKAGKKGGKEQPEEKKEPTPQELELQSAVNTEKSIFRFRMNILKQIAKRQLKGIRQQSLDFYAQLEDLLRYTYQVELEAIDRLSKLLRQKVEQQAKVQTELELNYVDVHVRQEVLNYLTPKPQIQPAREAVLANRFTVSQLYFLLGNIEAESEKHQRRIINRKLLMLLTRFTTNKQTNRALPESWLKHTFDDYERLISVLDFGRQGYILLKDLFTVIILSDCELPTADQLNVYRKDLQKIGGAALTADKFAKVPSWFDKIQSQQPQQNTNVFDRPRHLKQLLFSTLADPHTGQLSIDRLVDTISLSKLSRRPAAGSTYYTTVFH